jgi:D-glycero-D-manno-heptose 1,7-bisphosphate phosphatase
VKNRAVFLDRDGVINRSFVRSGRPYPPSNLEELEILPGVSDGLVELKAAGYLLIVVSNQPDIGRGVQSKKNVNAIHTILKEKLPLDAVYVCPHGRDGECNCRKPLPGMLLQASEDWQIDLSNSYMIGDRWKDIDAGFAVNCKTIFIDYGYSEYLNKPANHIAKDFLEVLTWILSDERNR